MGNDSSHLNGLEVNEKAVEITDFWAHYHATVNDTGYFFSLKGFGSISVFKTESPVLGSLWSNQSPLEKCSINLMKFRHPCMLRYVWHWQQRGVHYLTTECVSPLTQAIQDHQPIQVCVGLHHIAQALDFLHNNASLSHNNVSVGSIYVLPNGTWKLGGMEMAKPFKDMNSTYLRQCKKYRCDKTIDPNEEDNDVYTNVDQFAFGQLVEDVFKGRNTDDLPHWQDFKDYCQKELKNPTASQRPNFANILKHNFFNHDFISIHKFFTSLPLKTEKEKSVFFEGLLNRLKGFNEEIVARQLSSLILSRLVLLDSTAREKVLPHILAPKQDDSDEFGYFSKRIFVTYVTPHLMKMFRVRDIQVRLLLLKYFSGYSMTISKEDLTAHVLPELLLGIKDTNDNLVSMTLYCLAELVPILGAAAVIGGKRSKLFADGRPLTHSRLKSETMPQKIKQKHSVVLDKIEEDTSEIDRGLSSNIDHISRSAKSPNIPDFGSRESVEIETSLFLHERPSPDGGEDLDSEVIHRNVRSNAVSNADEDNWSDWDAEDNPNANDSQSASLDVSNETTGESSFDVNDYFRDSNSVKVDDIVNEPASTKSSTSRLNLQKAALEAKSKKLTDISELDIKNQKFNNSSTSQNKDEFDFFLDMEPVIEKASVLEIEQKDETLLDSVNLNSEISSKLSFVPNDTDEIKAENDGWGDTDWDD